MAGWGSDLGGVGAICNETEWLWDGDQDQAYVSVICRLPRDHESDHCDLKLDLTWPQGTAVDA